MPPQTPPSPDQWLEINDFSPGCFNNLPTTLAGDRLIPAPLGAADPAGTYSCQSLPNGGLAALPAMTAVYAWPALAGTTNYIVGFLVHDELGTGDTECFIIVEFDNGTNHNWSVYSYIVETAGINAIVDTVEASAGGIFGSPYPVMTRAYLAKVATATITSGSYDITVVSGGFPGFSQGDYITVLSGTGTIPPGTTIFSIVGNTLTMSAEATGSGTATIGDSSVTQPGNPTIAFPSGPPAQASGVTQVYMYPDPGNPSSYTPLGLISGSPGAQTSVAGQVIAHQNRVLVFAATNYIWPGSTLFFTNENINFTDPPNSTILGDQLTVLVAEEPYGYGAAGSISAGELFIVKHRGGGVVVTGDIFSPNVTSLPGVQGTGGIYGRADSGPVGFIYCSYANGAWLWNGGNTAQKISSKLDDNFFLPSVFGAMLSNNYAFFVQNVGDQIYFSNNWIYDTVSASWWKYYPDASQGGTDLYYMNPVSGRYLYAAPLSFSGAGNFLFRFDTATPAQTYQWTSLPLKLATKDHVVDIEEIAIHTSCTTAHCSLTVSILNKGSVVWTQAQTGNISPGPDILKFHVGAFGLTEPQIRVYAHNSVSGDMAVIHEVAFKYNVRAPQQANN
jgi:hypothetical protein